MARTIALSVLSLLPGSFFRGPEWTWRIAKEAGFDALKLAPLRGWEASKITPHGIPISAFEAPWRTSFKESVQALRAGDWMGFIADMMLFGKGAGHRSEWHANTFPKAIGIDCSAWYGDHFVSVRETNADRWPDLIDETGPVCLDTWHIRSYPNPKRVVEVLASQDRIRHIDVQTRDYAELLGFLRCEDVRLRKQLFQLRNLPDSVGASVELLPQQLLRLQGSLSLNADGVLRRLQRHVRDALRY